MFRSCSGLFLFAIAFSLAGCEEVPSEGVFHNYLTWQGDPSTTITVNYHTWRGGPSHVFYDTAPRSGDPSAYTFMAVGASHRIYQLAWFPGAMRVIHVVELTGLEPGAIYYALAGSPETGYADEIAFQTLPDGEPAIRFVVGGDMGTDASARELLARAAAEAPLFAVIGGDIAYANGQPGNWREWEAWLDNWEELMITPGGLSIPMILAIGNHEAAGGFLQFRNPLGRAPFYFGYFAQDGSGVNKERKAYFARRIRADTLLLCLDTGHVTPPGGDQAQWLEGQLSAQSARYTIAAYHVPLYPSHRAFSGLGSVSEIIRARWLPIFDAYGLTVGFEHHDHMHKRTVRLRDNAPDPTGTLYLGDGAFGRSPRSGDVARALDDPSFVASLGLPENYLANWSSSRHFWRVDILPGDEGIQFVAIDDSGATIDETFLTPR